MTQFRNIQKAGGFIDPLLRSDNPDLVYMWTMDNRSGVTVFDESANNNDLTEVGAVAYPAGKIGDAAESTALQVYLRSTTLGVTGSAARSFSTWVNISATSFRAYFSIEAANAIGKLWYMGLYDVGGVGKMYLDTSSLGARADMVTINTGQWYHCVVSFDGGTLDASSLHFYLDGVKQTTILEAGPGAPNTDDLTYVTHRNHTAGVAYPDKLDQMRMFSRTLTQADVDILFAEGPP